jgi:hypothetical protein
MTAAIAKKGDTVLTHGLSMLTLKILGGPGSLARSLHAAAASNAH